MLVCCQAKILPVTQRRKNEKFQNAVVKWFEQIIVPNQCKMTLAISQQMDVKKNIYEH